MFKSKAGLCPEDFDDKQIQEELNVFDEIKQGLDDDGMEDDEEEESEDEYDDEEQEEAEEEEADEANR